jgi:hypothetical protein
MKVIGEDVKIVVDEVQRKKKSSWTGSHRTVSTRDTRNYKGFRVKNSGQ